MRERASRCPEASCRLSLGNYGERKHGTVRRTVPRINTERVGQPRGAGSYRGSFLRHRGVASRSADGSR
jgi:hypothetical protein